MLPILIILHGLIALVPSSGGNSPMAALAIRTPLKMPGPCVAAHGASLSVSATNAQCVAVSGCNPNGPLCDCTVDGEDISLQILPASSPSPASLTRTAPRPLPFDSPSASDFSYLANMSLLGQTVDPGYLSPSVGSTLAPNLVARLQFPFDSVITCSLATRRVERSDNVYALNFRQLENEQQVNENSQALGQIALATFTPVGTGAEAVVLTLTKFDGSATRSLTLTPAGTDGYVIRLTDERVAYMVPDKACDDGVGRDFAFFYNLTPAASQQAWGQRQVPHVNYTSWKSALDVNPPACAIAYKYKTPMSRPICPMATFNP
jgi:hypothetical protein